MSRQGTPRDKTPFERQAAAPSRGTLAELGAYILETRKFWLVPIVLLLLLFGLFLVLTATPAAPLIYTLF